jgi:hypothetical protein
VTGDTLGQEEVNKALERIYDDLNKIANAVNSYNKPSAGGTKGDIRVIDSKLEYKTSKGWKKIEGE